MYVETTGCFSWYEFWQRGLICALVVLSVCISTYHATAHAQRSSTALIPVDDLRAAQRRYRSEPSADEVVARAMHMRHQHPSRIRDAIVRARWSGLLPRVQLGLRRGQAVDVRLLQSGISTPNVSTDDTLSLSARVTFRLSRLVFAREETSLLREMRATERARRDFSRLVLQLYYERRRLQLQRDLFGAQSLEDALRLLELEEVLNRFTNGIFRRVARE